MYKYIINPLSNRKVKITSKLGKNIIKNYLEHNLIHASNTLFKRGGGNIDEDEVCDNQCLTSIFGNFNAPIKTLEETNENNENINNTYGTITPNGVKKLCTHLLIENTDTFLDLGSGIGNVVIQFALNTPIKKSTGIEYLNSRYNKSIEFLNKFKHIFPSKLNHVHLINGDINNYDINENIVFTCSTCFPSHLMDSIKQKCEKNKNLKYLITQQKIEGNTTLTYLGYVITECSWNKECIQHIYTNTNNASILYS